MALQFMLDGRTIFVPQGSQSNGVAGRIAQLEQGGASFFRGSEIGWIREC
jgi:hypothetical protein